MTNVNKKCTTVLGGYEIENFTKTGVTHTGLTTYSDSVKRAIVLQYTKLLRDPLYNQTKASETLGGIHDVSSATILNWYRKFGTDLSVPVTKSSKIKKNLTEKKDSILKQTKVPTTTKDINNAVAVLSVLESTSILDKISDILKNIPEIEIQISIRPKKD